MHIVVMNIHHVWKKHYELSNNKFIALFLNSWWINYDFCSWRIHESIEIMNYSWTLHFVSLLCFSINVHESLWIKDVNESDEKFLRLYTNYQRNNYQW
jgi:hypothetical protein